MFLPLLSALSFLMGVLLGTWHGDSLFDLRFFGLEVLGSLWIFSALLLFKRPAWALLLIMLLFGLWRVEVYMAQAPEHIQAMNDVQESHASLVGEFVTLEGRIVEEVDRRSDHQKITVLTEHGRVLASVSLYVDVAFGDGVELSGQLQTPSDDIDGFSYANFLARYRIWLLMYDAGLTIIQEAKPSFRGTLFSLKTKMERRLNQIFFEPEASFSAGLLLGSRKGMPQNVADAFQRVGLTHIVAISGYNISLLIAGMFLMLGFLPLKTRVIASSVAIFVFVILVGASAAVVRAGIMGVLTLWALFSGRRSQVFFALLWSAIIMVLMNPLVLVYDVGFQLSFASTFGLLVFVPQLEKMLPLRVGSKKASSSPFGGVLREALLLTLAAQIATFPFTSFHFGRLSLISPFANVAVAAFLPFAMLFSALALFFGGPFVFLAWFYLRAVVVIALALAELPFIDIPLELSRLGFILSLGGLLLLSLKFYKSTLVRAFFRESEGVFSKFLNQE